MLNGLKQKVQAHRLVKEDAKYKERLLDKQNKYRELLQCLGDTEGINGVTQEEMIPLSSTDDIIVIEDFVAGKIEGTVGKNAEGFTVFASKNGMLSENAKGVFSKEFENPVIKLIYANEDVITQSGRISPVLKPDYAPDTLMSYMYMGSPVAVNNGILGEVLGQMSLGTDGYVNYYDLLLRVSEKLNDDQILHIDRVLYSGYVTDEADSTNSHLGLMGSEDKYDEIKEQAKKRLTPKNEFTDDHKPLVSIIIPSKDQPELMKECVASVYEKNPDFPFEIIVIDNGSVGANRIRITNLKDELGFRYYYEPGEFHFSKMCNSGAKKAQGEYLLFLNDDTKMIEQDTLKKLTEQCAFKHVGAVGVKLLYEDEKTIQHVGVINTQIGPVHIAIGKKDDESWYGGCNVINKNVLAVTGACMMIKTKTFEEVGGFDEAFRVSYNDVELCFKLYKAGYHNVICNDISVIHYESLSRGDDADNACKMERLLSERKELFEKHPDMADKDPYFSRFLDGTGDEIGIRIPDLNCRYKIQNMDKKKLPACENEALWVQIDHMGISDGLYEDTSQYLIEGWWYVIGQDNARYEAALIFQNKADEQIYTCEFESVLRMDVSEVLQKECNVELSGFSVLLKKNDLPKGEYEIGLLVKDKCSRQQLLRMVGKYADLW